MADYLVQEDGTSKILQEDGSSGLLLEVQTLQVLPFIASTTSVYTPTVPTLPVSFIASTTAVFAPIFGGAGIYTYGASTSWVCPPGCYEVKVEARGGGGTGRSSDSPNERHGGGGGAYAENGAVPVTPGNTYTVTVGGSGGTSTFVGDSSTTVSAVGGATGLAGGAGGQASASTGLTKWSGGNGGDGTSGAIGAGGAGGGEGAGSTADGHNGSPSVNNVAAGQPGGTGGDGGDGGQGGTYPSGSGLSGVAPGGGGGGGAGNLSEPGGAGANGRVEITLIPSLLVPFVSSATVVYAPTVQDPNVAVPFITSSTVVYAPTVGYVVTLPFIASATVVYAVQLPQVDVPFITSTSAVYGIFSLFDPNAVSTGPGNGGETFVVELNENGATETATLAADITTTSSLLALTGDTGLPASVPFVVTIDTEVLYVAKITAGSYRVRGRAVSNTAAASHTAGASVTWTDSYDVAIVAGADVAHEFTADINSSGTATYPGWLICIDSTQAYLAGDRYPMHVTEVVGVFDAGSGTTGSSRCDGAQPNAVSTPAAVSDDCPAALSNPARIQADIATGDVAVVRYTNPEASVLDIGPRSVALASWFGLKRVDDTDHDVTFTDPDGHVVDTDPGVGDFTGSVNGEWFNPLGPGIGPDTGTPTPNDVPYTSVTLPGVDRFFTYGSPHYNEKGWPICCLAVRQGSRRIPHWRSWDWHDFTYVYTGFGVDNTFAQLLVNRNGLTYGSVPEVNLPGPQDIDGPDAVWDDGSYRFGASWYVAIFNTPYLVSGPGIGGEPGGGGEGGEGGGPPGVTFPPSAPPIVTVPPPIVEGGGGGDIPPPAAGRQLFQAIHV